MTVLVGIGVCALVSVAVALVAGAAIKRGMGDGGGEGR